MKISDNVRAVQVPDESPMHPDVTTIYLVGDKQALAIDSGEAIDHYRWMLRGYLAAVEKTEIAHVGITHHHGDHSGNLAWASEALDADVIVTKEAVPFLKGRLPKKRVERLDVTKPLRIEGGPTLQVIRAPGHSPDSLVYYIEDEGILFAGDTLLGRGTTTVTNLADYMRTLNMLLELPNLKVICPGHGPVINDPKPRIETYIKHRTTRELQILDAVEGKGAVTSWDIMMAVYPDVNPRLRRAAEGNVRSHLTKLTAEGRIKVYEGVPKSVRPPTKREVEHAKVRSNVIKQARQYEAEERRSRLRAQENPAGALWKDPPRFELVGAATE